VKTKEKKKGTVMKSVEDFLFSPFGSQPLLFTIILFLTSCNKWNYIFPEDSASVLRVMISCIYIGRII